MLSFEIQMQVMRDQAMNRELGMDLELKDMQKHKTELQAHSEDETDLKFPF